MNQPAEKHASGDVWDAAYAALFTSSPPVVPVHDRAIADVEAEMVATLADMPAQTLPRC